MTESGTIEKIAEELVSSKTFTEAAERLLGWARELTGCEAAMLRFVEDDELPGMAWIPAVVEQGADIGFLRDETLVGAGECLCGRVCRGGSDPHSPFFTSGGSFSCGRAQSHQQDSSLTSLGYTRGTCVSEGYESIGIFPLVAKGRPFGCLHLADRRPDRLEAHISTLEEACRVCGPALFGFPPGERRECLIRAVESALKPAGVPRLAELEVAVSYMSATESAHLGGDFYDVVRLPRGDNVLVVGDYSGKGIGAAGIAARARQILAGAARSSQDLVTMFRQADGELEEVLPENRYVTAVACRHSGDGYMRCLTAGHPAPLLLEEDGRTAELPLASSLPLGLSAGIAGWELEWRLVPGQVLLFYTDGITESRRDGEFFGVGGISALWQEMRASSLKEFTAELCRASGRFHNPGLANDDRLALAVRLHGA
jgi:serine phosphatase RsbU (regulator of sigma subunit)